MTRTLPIVVLAALAAAPARAAETAAALYVEGANAEAVRDQLTDLMARSRGTVPHATFARELAAAGWKELGERRGEGVGAAEIGMIGAAARAVGAGLVILGHVDQPGAARRQLMRLVVIDASSSVVLGDERVPIAVAPKKKARGRWRIKLRAADAAIERALARLGGAAGGVSWGELPDWAGGKTGAPATALESPEDEEEADEEEEDGGEDASAGAELGPAFGVASAGLSFGGRRFRYEDPVTSNLRPFEPSGGPGFALALQLYPLVPSGAQGLLADVGIDAGYAQALGLESVIEDRPGSVIKTVWRRWHIGPRARFDVDPLQVGLSVVYDELAFTFDAPPELDVVSELPSARYRCLRAGLDARWQLQAFNVAGGIAYDHILASGPVGDDYFPRSRKAGVDVELGGGMHVHSGFTARLVGRYTHVWYEMRARPGDPYVASGALDQYLTLELGVQRAF